MPEDVTTGDFMLEEFRSLRLEIAAQEESLDRIKRRALYLVGIVYLIVIFKSLPLVRLDGISIPETIEGLIEVFPIGIVLLSAFEYYSKFAHVKHIGSYLRILESKAYCKESNLGWERFLMTKKANGLSEHRGARIFWTSFSVITIVIYFRLQSG